MKEYYSIYVYKYNSLVSYVDIEAMINKSGLQTGITITDMSDMDDCDVIKAMNDIIRAERVREYFTFASPAIVHFIMKKDGRFTLILSLYEGKNTLEMTTNVMKAFGIHNEKVTPVSLYGNAKGNVYESTAYWQEMLPELLTMDMKECMLHSNGNRQVERYYLDDELKQVFLAVMQAKRKSIKAILMNVWGRILSANLKQPTILLEDVHEGGNLCRVPILYRNDMPLNEAYESMKEQLINAERNDMCTYEKLDMIMENKLSKRTLISQELCYDTKYDMFLSRLRDKTVYKFVPYEFSTAPLNIKYNIADNELSVTYDFDCNYFESVNFEDIHAIFCKVFRAHLLGNDYEVNSSVVKNVHADSVLKVRIRDMKAKCLANLRVFDGYSESEYKELAEKFEVVHKDIRQEAISQNYECDKLFFIVKGKMEVDGIDSKRFVRPLLMLKECEVFGIEALLSNNKSRVLYQVFSDEVILLSIRASEFKLEAYKHPELMERILEIQSDRMDKFAKLWMMT